jgi:hypothetical protein
MIVVLDAEFLIPVTIHPLTNASSFAHVTRVFDPFPAQHHLMIGQHKFTVVANAKIQRHWFRIIGLEDNSKSNQIICV